MTTLQKTLVASTVFVMAGAGIFEAHQASQLRDQVQTLQQQQATSTRQIQQLRNNLASATNQLAELLSENTRLKGNQDQAALLKMRGQVTLLGNELSKQMAANNETNRDDSNPEEDRRRSGRLLMRYFDANPNARIPEMTLLPKGLDPWTREYGPDLSPYMLAVNVAAQLAPTNYGLHGVFDENQIKLETNEQYRRAASELRLHAEFYGTTLIQSALHEFQQANNGAFPTSISDLQPFWTNSVDQSILQRWEIQPASNFQKVIQAQITYHTNYPSTVSVITQRAAVDEDYDHRVLIGPDGVMVGDPGSFKQ